MKKVIRSTLLSTILLLTFAAAAQEPASLFIDRVDVDVVNVEVFVIDKQGNRVTGLTVDDFEVFEDGQPVEITNFYAVDRGDRVINRFGEDRRMIEGRQAVAPRELPEDQQLNLVVYVDHFNLRPHNRARVLKDLEEFLEDRITLGDNIMLVGFDRKLEIVHPFTRERSEISEGLSKMAKTATHAQMDDARRRQLMQLMAPTPAGPAGPLSNPLSPGDDALMAYQMIRSYVEQVRNEIRYSMRALEETTRALAGLPGRKALIYVSDGIPKRPGESLYQQFADIYGNELPSGNQGIDPFVESINEAENHLMNDVIRQANAHQVTFYTLDARGPGGGSLSSGHVDWSAGNGGHAALDVMRSLNLQEPLVQMAHSTGGSTVFNTYNFDVAFDALSEDFDSFYSLGYRARRGGDGRYHKIDVRVKSDDVRVRHRSGYVDKPEEEKVADRTLSSLMLNLEKNPLGIDVDFGIPEKQGRDTYHLPVMVRIPFREVTLLPSGSVEQGRLRIFLAVQDEKGGVSKPQDFSYPLSVPTEQVAAARDREIGYVTTLKIRGGVPKVAVGVWDELSGTESFVHKRVLVGEEGKKKSRRG